MPAPARLTQQLETIARGLAASGPITSSRLAEAAHLSISQARRWVARWERDGLSDGTRLDLDRAPGRRVGPPRHGKAHPPPED